MAQIRIKLKKFVANLLIIFSTIVFIFICGEISLRFYHYHKYGINILNGANHVLTVKDDRLGWKLAKNLSFDIKAQDGLGNPYNVHFETNKYGFKMFGNPQSNKLKIFFVGDSFTEAFQVSNDKTYYAFVKQKVKDIEVFAYGVGGYSSLQEFMILDEFLDLIKPNIIVLQFYEDNFFRNDDKLDRMKAFYNTGMARPFLDLEGRISYRYPKCDNLFLALPSPVAENLRLLKIINQQLGLLANIIMNRTIYDKITQLGEAHQEFRHSTEITKLIMSMVKRRAGQIPVYLFCITETQPFYDTINNICQSVGIHFIDGVPKGLTKFENERRYITKSHDRAHLNELGDRIIGEKLIEYFNKSKIN
jgi:hypothetical protein